MIMIYLKFLKITSVAYGYMILANICSVGHDWPYFLGSDYTELLAGLHYST